MLTIRFKAIGRKHRKFYRIIVSDKRSHPTKKFLETLGNYNPYTKVAVLNKERVQHFVDLNIELSDSVKSLFLKEGVIKKEVAINKETVEKKATVEKPTSPEKKPVTKKKTTVKK